jgi:hypothetical protein
VVNGQPQGGIQKITVNKGQRVRFRVVSDVADEIHVHGYDFHSGAPRSACWCASPSSLPSTGSALAA